MSFVSTYRTVQILFNQDKMSRNTHIFVYIILILIHITCIVLSILSGDTPEEYFQEGRFMTWLSSINLAILSGISLCSFFVLTYQKPHIKNKKLVLVVLCSAGFVFLSADDWFKIHENLDFMIHEKCGIKETSLTDRLDDLIVLIYGIAGISVTYLFCKSFWNERKTKIWLLISIILFLIMVMIDFVSNDDYLYKYFTDNRNLDYKIGMILSVIEDSCKDLAETALIISFLEIFQSLFKGFKTDLNATLTVN